MKLLNRLIIFLISLFCNTLYPQAKSQLNWTTDSESLPQNSIKSIAPDKYGYIWMSTENGLVRYDGREFNVYDNNNIGIKNNRFIQIMGDYKSDSLYTSNEFQEDYILINKRIARKANLPKNPKLLGFRLRNDGSFISAGSPNIFGDTPRRPYIIPLPSGNYFFIKEKQLHFYNSKNKLIYTLDFDYEANNNFFTFGDTLFYLKNNSEYAVIANGKISWKKLNLPIDKNSKVYWNTVSHQVFVYATGKLYHIDYNSGNLTAGLLMEEDLIANNVCCIYYDSKSNIVYLGSIKKGLGIYKIKQFTAITPNILENPELYEIFYALHPFTDSTAISASGIIMNNKDIIDNLHFISDKFSIAVDTDNNIWVKRGAILYNYRKSDNYKKPRRWTFPHDISALFLGKDSNIWFDQNLNDHTKSSIWYFRPGKNPVFHKFRDVAFKINYFAQSKTDIIWMGSNKGLYKMDIKYNKLYSYPATANIKIRNVYLTDENNIWLTTYEKGFYLLKDKKLCRFPMDKNHFLKSSHSIVEDKNGYFWISTNKGLFQMTKQSLINYAGNKSKIPYYHYYNKEYGFLSNEFNGGSQPNGITLKNGNIFFPSINGVVNFKPYDITPILPDKNIYIDEVVIDGKRSIISDTLNLDRHFERITFYIASPYYGSPDNLNFEVKLEGPSSQDWMEVSKEHNISFTKLSPGTYILTARKKNGFDGTYAYKKITVFIKPAFWQTSSFTVLAYFFAFLLAFLLYSLRVNYIINKNKQLQKAINEKTKELKMTISTLLDTEASLKKHIDNNTRIIKYITHDIKSPLKFMAMATRYMYDTEDLSTEELKDNLKSIFTSSTQMYNFVDNLLEYSKVYLNKDETEIIPSTVHDIINDKIALFEGIAHYQNTVIKNQIPKNYQIRVNKQLLSIALHNLLDNAVKNTHNGQIIFSCYNSENKIHIEIKDSGSGMSKDTLNHYRSIIRNYNPNTVRNSQRLGLQIVIEMMLTWGETITIDSILDKGTTITLIFNETTLVSKAG